MRARRTTLWTTAMLVAVLLFVGCNKEGGEEGVEASSGGPAAILVLETFLTNINDGDRHARVQVKLAVVPQEAVEAMKTDEVLMARLHDRVLTLLSRKTYRELSEPEGKEAFRKQILDELAPLVTKGQVQEVLFSDFVVE